MTDTPTITPVEWMYQLVTPSFISANASLPDGDPRKITRADVQMLRLSAEDSPGQVAADMRTLAAKLTALLPEPSR